MPISETQTVPSTINTQGNKDPEQTEQNPEHHIEHHTEQNTEQNTGILGIKVKNAESTGTEYRRLGPTPLFQKVFSVLSINCSC